LSWQLIESTTLASPAASVSFSTGLSGYKFFRLTYYAIHTASSLLYVRLNNDSGSNYSAQQIAGDSTSVFGARVTSQAQWAPYSVSAIGGKMTGVLNIAKPAAGVKAQLVTQQSANLAAAIKVDLTGGEWNNTADLISRIDLLPSSGNFDTGSSFLLEGLSF